MVGIYPYAIEAYASEYRGDLGIIKCNERAE